MLSGQLNLLQNQPNFYSINKVDQHELALLQAE